MPADNERVLRVLESDELLERLASVEHERWAHWQAYIHNQCVPGDNGDLTIPGELVSRWTTQINMPYEELSEAERESDRDQVRRYLPIILKAFEEEF